MRAGTLFSSIIIASSVALGACTRDSGDSGAAADSADARDSAAATARSGSAAGDSARRIGSIDGFNTPESVKYDADLDVYFVSNINGNPSNKDGNGWIARVKPDSAVGTTTMDTLVRGGQAGVTLNAPKGMAIVGDTLWVADIDAVRGFNKRTGAPTRSVSLTSMQATFLNDIAVDSAGTLYITDTGIRFAADGSMGTPGKQRIFALKGAGPATVAIEGDSLGNPNGIALQGVVFIVGPFSSKSVMRWTPRGNSIQAFATGAGQYDGVEVLGDGRILISSWADSSVSVVSPTAGTVTRLISGVDAPADIGYDSKRDRVLIPLFNGNRVEIWTTGRR